MLIFSVLLPAKRLAVSVGVIPGVYVYLTWCSVTYTSFPYYSNIITLFTAELNKILDIFYILPIHLNLVRLVCVRYNYFS
jgi:uncharacterized oligopeptide transporter (OPT) family protein